MRPLLILLCLLVYWPNQVVGQEWELVSEKGLSRFTISARGSLFGADGFEVLRSNDHQNWIAVGPQGAVGGAKIISLADSSIVVGYPNVTGVTQQFGLYISRDDGETWDRIPIDIQNMNWLKGGNGKWFFVGSKWVNSNSNVGIYRINSKSLEITKIFPNRVDTGVTQPAITETGSIFHIDDNQLYVSRDFGDNWNSMPLPCEPGFTRHAVSLNQVALTRHEENGIVLVDFEAGSCWTHLPEYIIEDTWPLSDGRVVLNIGPRKLAIASDPSMYYTYILPEIPCCLRIDDDGFTNVILHPNGYLYATSLDGVYRIDVSHIATSKEMPSGGQRSAELKIWPSPSSNNLFFRTNSGRTILEAVLTDILGRSYPLFFAAGSLTNGVDISGFKSGLYFLKVLDSAGEVSLGSVIIVR